MQTPFTSPIAALKFILGGKSFSTLVSLATGTRFTYRVELADKKNPSDADVWFVSVLNGPDNWTNYKYIGIIKNNEYRWTSKSKISEEAPSVKAFKFCFGHLSHNTIIGFEVWHEGKCGRCGRKLTVPESIASGFGPECIGLVGAARVSVSGTAAPQGKFHYTPRGGESIKSARTRLGVSGRGVAEAIYAPAKNSALITALENSLTEKK
jgi:uncharacterized protein DUF6011